MPNKLTPEQFWQLYQKLPQELKDALFAEETGDNIEEICQRNEAEDDIDKIVDLVGQVLAGILPPNEFQTALEKEAGLEKDLAKKVAQEINRFIFYPVKPALEQLYKIGASPTEKTATKPEIEKLPEESKKIEEEPSISPRKDTYREPFE